MSERAQPCAALEAWRSLAGTRADPLRIEVVKQGRDGTAVHRLVLRGGAKCSVIAKRAREETAAVERTVYEEILPGLPVPTLGYHGSVEDPEGAFRWLFLEDARGGRYRRERPSHRAAAARWLAVLHRSLATAAGTPSLPARSPAHYRRLLGSVREALQHRLDAPELETEGYPVLEAVIGHCDGLASRWGELESACAGAPDTLVHGDFIDHNVHVRRAPSGLVFLPFDWEKAGWGVPAEDLSSVDGDAYWDGVKAAPGALAREPIRRLAGAGRIFRCLVFLDWVVHAGACDGLGQEIEQIALCRSWLDPLLGESPWR
jgi:aminoglycoside phosphotransferase (APT) family kinase protein